jgi:hypothetical protein
MWVPASAWSWLQRSRAALHEIAARLYADAPPANLIEELRRLVPVDEFVRGVVLDAICEQVFRGRPPDRRPQGASWDRGLVWWAATLNGVTTSVFEARSLEAAPSVVQPPLFGPQPALPAPAPAPVQAPPRPPWRSGAGEREWLARALRALLAEADEGQIPASAVRGLLRQLEA